MKKLIDEIEETFRKDPVVFAWSNMIRKSNKMDEKESLVLLIRALINSKNTAIKVIDKYKQDAKVIRLVK